LLIFLFTCLSFMCKFMRILVKCGIQTFCWPYSNQCKGMAFNSGTDNCKIRLIRVAKLNA
jgi:hypothetical protein